MNFKKTKKYQNRFHGIQLNYQGDQSGSKSDGLLEN